MKDFKITRAIINGYLIFIGGFLLARRPTALFIYNVPTGL